MENSLRFDVLPGLPGTGPLPTHFSSSGEVRYSEGLVVRFHTAQQSWVGNFGRGYFGYFDGAFFDPAGDRVIVIAGGQAYVVDPVARIVAQTFGGDIQSVLSVADGTMLIFSNGLWLEAIGPGGILWKTRRIALDGFRHLRIVDNHVVGQADCGDDHWLPFEVDLQSGDAVGGGDFRGTLTP